MMRMVDGINKLAKGPLWRAILIAGPLGGIVGGGLLAAGVLLPYTIPGALSNPSAWIGGALLISFFGIFIGVTVGFAVGTLSGLIAFVCQLLVFNRPRPTLQIIAVAIGAAIGAYVASSFLAAPLMAWNPVLTGSISALVAAVGFGSLAFFNLRAPQSVAVNQ